MKYLLYVKCTKVPTNAFHTDVVQENESDTYLMSEPCMRMDWPVHTKLNNQITITNPKPIVSTPADNNVLFLHTAVMSSATLNQQNHATTEQKRTGKFKYCL